MNNSVTKIITRSDESEVMLKINEYDSNVLVHLIGPDSGKASLDLYHEIKNNYNNNAIRIIDCRSGYLCLNLSFEDTLRVVELTYSTIRDISSEVEDDNSN